MWGEGERGKCKIAGEGGGCGERERGRDGERERGKGTPVQVR